MSLGFDDPRLAGPRLDARDCFWCGHKIASEASGCWVQSQCAGDIKVAAHRACINGQSDLDVAARYQRALFAGLTGTSER